MIRRRLWGQEVESPRGAFAMWFVLTSVCGVGVLFYLRFLIAVCKECRFTRVCYLVRLEPQSHEESIEEAVRGETMFRRAA